MDEQQTESKPQGLLGVAKAKRSAAQKAKLVVLGGVVGVVLGAGGTMFALNYNPPDRVETMATVVFERIVSQNELVSVSQDYSIVDKASDVNTLFGLIDIPFTENSFWYRYEGTLKAGVNLETADVRASDNTVTITLDAPYIISNTPDMERTQVLEENNNPILNPIHVEDVDAFQRQAVEQSEANAVEGGLLEDARVEAENRLTTIYVAALGEDCTVNVVWRDQQGA